jgi:hypothetical protein
MGMRKINVASAVFYGELQPLVRILPVWTMALRSMFLGTIARAVFGIVGLVLSST